MVTKSVELGPLLGEILDFGKAKDEIEKQIVK